MSEENKADKRSVTTDALASLGNCPIPDNSGRDAIHLAVEPVVAPDILIPGQLVNAKGGVVPPFVGIVDPFISGVVEKGSKFWLVLLPRTITSLRHVWSHPAFGEEAQQTVKITREESHAWLRSYVANNNIPSYDQMMDALEYDTESPCFCNDGGAEIPLEFWMHYENVTGKIVPHDKRGDWFRCAC